VEYMLSWFEGAPEIDALYVAVRNEVVAASLRKYLKRRKQYLPEILDMFRKLGYHVEYTNNDLEIKVLKAVGWGTGGDLRYVLEQIGNAGALGDDFIVCYADYIINRTLPDGGLSLQMDLSDIIRYHYHCQRTLGTVMTVAFVVVKKEEATRFGVGQLEEVGDGKVVRGFIEKPDISHVPEEPAVNAGISVINSRFLFPRIEQYLPGKPGTSLEKNLMEQLAKEERPMLAACLLDLDAWFDVGTLQQLIDTNIFIASKKV